jgi:phytanoyl-CoA hydroxylase
MPESERYLECRDDPTTLKQLQHMWKRDEFFRSLIVEGAIPELASDLLGEDVAPQNLQYFNKPPRIGKATPPHQDGYYFHIDPMRAVTIWLALEDVSVEQGCVRYVRGSHRDGLRPHARSGTLGFSQAITDYGASDRSREVALPCRAGHLIAHDALTIHMAEKNTTEDRSRQALGFIYFAASCTTDETAAAQYQTRLDAELRQQNRI